MNGFELEGYWRVGSKWYKRVTNGKISKFEIIKNDYRCYYSTLDETKKVSGYRLLTTPDKNNMVEKKYTTYSDFYNFIDNYKDSNDISVLTPEKIDILNNYYGKTNVPNTRIWYMDIEVIDLKNRIFPKPELAKAPITHIQILDNKSNKIIILYTKEASKKLKEKYQNVHFIYCKSEKTLIKTFILLLKKYMPTILTFWNGDDFDVPYILNRSIKLGININDFSPLNQTYISEIQDRRKTKFKINIKGLYAIDMLRAYKKFVMKERKSYSLEYITKIELNEGEGKISYKDFKSIFDFYEKDYDGFTEYAIRDVEVLRDLDKKLNLMNLVIGLSKSFYINYDKVFGTIFPWENYITIEAYKKGYLLPYRDYNEESESENIIGGYVREPNKLGFSGWVFSIDYNSLYPSIMNSFNLSPDTYIKESMLPKEAKEIYDYFRDENEDKLFDNEILNKIKKVTKKHNIIFSGLGFFKKEHKGIIPILVSDVYYSRKEEKKKMLLASTKV